MTDLKELFKTLPTTVTLKWADMAEEPEETIVVGLSFTETGFGFGEIFIKQTTKGVFIDTEHMGKEKVKEYLNKLIDNSITDVDQDPEKHKKYREVMGGRCGEHCSICYPKE